MASIRVDDLDIAYERVGDGPPLVLIHGGLADARMWQPQLAALADEFTVVAWDEPGAGRSSDVPSGFDVADYGRCLAAVVEALDLGAAHVAGLSWGATVALDLHRQHPELVKTLILAGAYAGWKGSLPPDEVHRRVDGVERMLEAMPDVAPTLPGLFAADPPAEYVRLLDAMASTVRLNSARTSLLAMAETDQRGLLPLVTVPTLLIWGELDARSPLRVAHQFLDAIPGAELHVLPGAGHVTNLERPAAFNDAVRAFCHAHP